MRGCTQSTSAACPASSQFVRIGVDATTGGTGNGQWQIPAAAGAATVLLNASNRYVLSVPLQIDGVATTTTDLSVKFDYLATADPPGSFSCSTAATAVYSAC